MEVLRNLSTFVNALLNDSGGVADIDAEINFGKETSEYKITLRTPKRDFEYARDISPTDKVFATALHDAEIIKERLAKRRIKSEIKIFNSSSGSEWLVGVEFYGVQAYVLDKLVGNPKYGFTREEVVEGILEKQLRKSIREGKYSNRIVGELDLAEARELGHKKTKPRLERQVTVPSDEREYCLYLRMNGLTSYAIPKLLQRGLHGLCTGETIQTIFNFDWLLNNFWKNFPAKISLEGTFTIREAEKLGYIPIKRRAPWRNAN